MNAFLTHLAHGLVDRHTFGAIMIVAIAAIGWRNRGFLARVLDDDEVVWRAIGRGFAAAFVLAAVWIGLFDDWIQLFSEPYRRTRDLSTERVVADPIRHGVRAITIVLLIAVILTSAAIVARHIGGYGLQIGMLVGGLAFWAILFIFHQRLDILVHDGAADPITSTGSFIGLAMFWVLRTGLGVMLAFLSLGIVTCAAAPVVTLLLDLLRIRKPRVVAAQSQDFFATLQEQASRYVPEETPQSRKRQS